MLVNPPTRMQVYQSLGTTLAAIEPPVWAGLIATFVRNRGLSVQILDANAGNLTIDETADRITDLKPLLTAVVAYGHQPSASTQTMSSVGAICTSLKKSAPDLPTIMVGGHVAALPKRTLQEEDTDFVCAGEGPYTVLELVQALKAGRPDEISKVRGLWYRDGQTLKATPPAPLVTELDLEMPGMAWDLFDMDQYRAHNWHCFGDLNREPYASIYTTLGCPYRCTFCCIQAPFKSGEDLLGYKPGVNSYRFWSPEVVLNQIDELVNKYGVRNLKIADELFVLNPRHVSQICDHIIERGYELNVWAYARVDSIRDNMLEKLKRAGVNWLGLGIESASERVRNEAQKGFEQGQEHAIVEKLRAAGINVAANYIFGLPEDDQESMQATLDLAVELNAEWSNFYCAMAYPGSELYQTAIKEEWALPVNWSGYSQHAEDTLPLPTRYLSASEVLRFRDDAFQTYFNDSRYLDMITRKFGPATTQHIREMASHTLVRNNA